MHNKASVSNANKIFHNKIAAVYDYAYERNHTKVTDLYFYMFSKIDKYFKENNIKKLDILDIGCGTGKLEEFIDLKNARVLGLDISSQMIQIAKKKYPKVQFKVADISSLPKGKKYDLIMGNAVLHHLKDYESCLAQCLRLLKPKGVIFFGAEPNYYFYHYFSRFIDVFRNFMPDKRQVKANSSEELETLSEYHVYYSHGINPYKLKKHFCKSGFVKVNIDFSSRELMASLIDRMNLKLINHIPNFLMDSTGMLSRVFYITAYK